MAITLDGTTGITFPNATVQSAAVANNAAITALVGVRGLSNTIVPVGTVLQVVNAKATATTTSSSTSAVSLTGMSANITISAGSSILALSTAGIYGAGNSSSWSSTGRIWLYRGATVLCSSEHMGVITSLEQTATHSIMYFDQSLSAGTYTYAVKGSSTTGGTLNFNRDAYMGNLILMEIAG